MNFLKLYAALQVALADKKGAAMIEYALLAALISVVAITALTSIGTSIGSKFNAVSAAL